MKSRPKFYFVGGAKGTGKTLVTSAACLELNLKRVETGKIVRDYLSRGLNIPYRDHIAHCLMEEEQDTLIDTHYAPFPCLEREKKTAFSRGLEKEHLEKLAAKYDIKLCLFYLESDELLKRRIGDSKKRITTKDLVSDELIFNEMAAKIYSQELKTPIFYLRNDERISSKERLLEWITTHSQTI
ncbi:MAG: hypothetical protein KKE23_01735 [Nanoarchaeota archaeon]|nr:hypothetical protein [Nanoarchaeota archaeon]